MAIETPRYALIVKANEKGVDIIDHCLLCDVEQEVTEGAWVIGREDDECMPEQFNPPRIVDHGEQ